MLSSGRRSSGKISWAPAPDPDGDPGMPRRTLKAQRPHDGTGLARWRRGLLLTVLSVLACLLAAPSRTPAAPAEEGYRRFLAELWPEAERLGISRATFERAFEGVEPDRSLPDLVLT